MGRLTTRPTSTFTLPAEHALLLADDGQPHLHARRFRFRRRRVGRRRDADRCVPDRRRASAGTSTTTRLFTGTERFFRPGYQANLVQAGCPPSTASSTGWTQGIRVADVGCGYGAATMLSAQTYPNSTFVGFDYHDASIAAARSRADDAGVASTVTFEVAGADWIPRPIRPDLPVRLPARHGRPGRRRPARQGTLRPGGSLLVVEPNGADRPEDNHHPLGRLFYASSTAICLPGSLAQDGQLGLGNQAGTSRLTQMLTEAGFGSVRVATSTPINVIIQARG